MTKAQKMELRKKLREAFIQQIKTRVSRDVENEGLRVMSENLSLYTKEQGDQILAFIRFGEDWSYARPHNCVNSLTEIYRDFGLTDDMMPLKRFVMQYQFMYASEAVRTINEWRERNGAGCETAY